MREKTLGPCAVLWVHGRRAEAVGAAGMRSVLPVSSRPSLPLSWAPLHAPAPCGGGVGPLPSERGPHGADGRARGCFQATPAASCCHLDSEAEPGPLGPAPRAWGASPGLRRAGAAGRKAARLRVLGAWAAGHPACWRAPSGASALAPLRSELLCALRPAFQPQRASLGVFGFMHLLWNCFPVEKQPQTRLLFYCNVGGPQTVAVARGSWASASLRSPGLHLGHLPAAAGVLGSACVPASALGAEVGPRAALSPRVPGCTLCLEAWWAQATDYRDRNPRLPGQLLPRQFLGQKPPFCLSCLTSSQTMGVGVPVCC